MSRRRARTNRAIAALVQAVVIIGAISMPAKSRADDDERWLPWIALGVGAVVVADIGTLVAGSVFAVGNASYAAYPDKASSKHWRHGGYILGGMNLAAGTVILAGAISLGEDTEELYALSIAHLVIGAVDIGFAVWGSQEPEPAKLGVEVHPLVMTDYEGNPAFGAGVAVVGW